MISLLGLMGSMCLEVLEVLEVQDLLSLLSVLASSVDIPVHDQRTNKIMDPIYAKKADRTSF